MANLPVVGGINAQAVRTIPTDWDPQWFKRFISDHMQKMDYRNATAGAGITITGTEQTTGSISAGGTLSSPVIIPAPATATYALTVNGISGQAAVVIVSNNSATTATGDLDVNRAGSTANAVAEGPNIILTDTTNTTATCLQNSGGQSELWQYNSGAWKQVIVVGAAGGVTLGTSTSTTVLNGTGLSFPHQTVTASASTGSNGAPPAQVSGYMTVSINGATRHIPYYN